VDQHTSFAFEIVVSDDGSTDGTSDIVRGFAERYPDVVRVFIQPQNIGGNPNYLFVHEQARGQYVAHVDGDDYAFPGKLQKLHDCIDRDPTVNIVWHRMKILDETGRWATSMPLEPDTARSVYGSNRISLACLLLFYSVGGFHSGSMYRRSARKLPEADCPTLDYSISLALCESGDGYHIDEPLGVYRWFASERTITKTPENRIVNDALLGILRHYGKVHPKHRRSVAAHVAMKGLIALYLRNPFWKQYARLFVDLRTAPRPADLAFIWRVFDRGRSKRLRKKLAEPGAVAETEREGATRE